MAWLARIDKKFARFCLIEKIITQLDGAFIILPAEKYRNPFVELRYQRFVGIDVDCFHGEGIFAAEGLQCLEHVVAQMAIGAGI